jgi:hypothetical protein
MVPKEYPEKSTASILVRRAGSELLDAAQLTAEPLKTHLYQVAKLCDETLLWLWQQRSDERKGAA